MGPCRVRSLAMDPSIHAWQWQVAWSSSSSLVCPRGQEEPSQDFPVSQSEREPRLLLPAAFNHVTGD